MKDILARIAWHARQRPTAVALNDGVNSFDYAALWVQVESLARQLEGRRIAFLLDNGSAWALLDLAVQLRGSTGIPLPTFFSQAQIEHLLADAAPDLVVTARCSDGEIMGVRHKTLPLEGVQFHPESVLTPEGDTLMTNFMRMECP